ncbi:MAG TPA: cation:proton antiporter [Bryobacteraceae bacterium]|nr:cation:proton antiporter [Bryobacteraceae bacterium]
MTIVPLVFLACLLFLFSLVSERTKQTWITAPMVFTAAGILAFPFVPQALLEPEDWGTFLHIAELGLVLLLFTEACHLDFHILKIIHAFPARLLSVGMLLTIVAGAAAAKLVFPQLAIWEAGILGAILAPTDAGLGQTIITSPCVPVSVRKALSVETGLNDGLAVPFLMFFIALAAAEMGVASGSLPRLITEQLGLGALTGSVIGIAGGWLMGMASRKHWMEKPFRPIAVTALPLLCMMISEAVGASMFIAAFVAGLGVQRGFREAGQLSVEFAETWGQLINLTVFFLFGMVVARDWRDFSAPAALYAALSLTVVRMIPVAISLIGCRLSIATVLFTGWFGPRGLASIVLGLVYLEQEINLPGEAAIQTAVTMTVALSIVAHGLTAVPGASLYARRVERLGALAPERADVASQPA